MKRNYQHPSLCMMEFHAETILAASKDIIVNVDKNDKIDADDIGIKYNPFEETIFE